MKYQNKTHSILYSLVNYTAEIYAYWKIKKAEETFKDRINIHCHCPGQNYCLRKIDS